MTQESSQNNNSSYTDHLQEVISSEKEYVSERRRKNRLPKPNNDLSGICFSGGGIRSATLCLGIMQRLIKENVFKKFDYLSTVSGGGYIGSCLTSLLSRNGDTGVDPKHSPFVGLHEKDEYKNANKTELGVRHQLHHLRTHGDYLITRKRLLSRDVQRAVGTIISGIMHHIILYTLLIFILASFTHLALTSAVDNFKEIGFVYKVIDQSDTNTADTGENVLTEIGKIGSEWVIHSAKKLKGLIVHDWKKADSYKISPLLAYMVVFVLGILWNLGFLISAGIIAGNISKRIKRREPPPPKTRSGFNIEAHYESKFISFFNWGSIVLILVIAFLFGWLNSFKFHSILFLPFVFALSGRITTYLFVNISKSLPLDNHRIHRSLYNGLQGAAFYGLLLSVIVPVSLILLFSISYFTVRLSGSLVVSLLSLMISYFLIRKKSDQKGWIHRVIEKLKKPLLNLLVILFIGLSFSFATIILLEYIYPEIYRFIAYYYPDLGINLALPSFITLLIGLILFATSGLLININRISPHYFYRDRLTEAYLQTDARIQRDCPGKVQGMPLKMLRNDEDLKLVDLGESNNKGPYHIIVTALNLQGSVELNRKEMLSEHFIFTKNFVGSKITGYMPTADYRNGETKLARAMTISAAAAASGMGFHSFLAQSFIMTLFNARLGYWMANPWYYNKCKKKDPERGIINWPKYLLYEMLGLSTARSRLVNLSDGGHTGDNLGLIPLLQRRCNLIVVCDGEADGNYSFESFNNAVRMAYIEDNIKIKIDLSKLASTKDIDGLYKCSEKSVAVGDIFYPGKKHPGKIIYLKSSVSENLDSTSKEKIPVHVINYLRNHKDFPHETTADQFFDDAQFEAYRALGEHIGCQAVAHIGPVHQTTLSNDPDTPDKDNDTDAQPGAEH